MNKNIIILSKNYEKNDDNFYNNGVIREIRHISEKIELSREYYIYDLDSIFNNKSEFNSIYNYYNDIYISGDVSKTLSVKLKKRGNISLFTIKYISQPDGYIEYIKRIPGKFFDDKSIGKNTYLDLLKSDLDNAGKSDILGLVKEIKTQKDNLKGIVMGKIFQLLGFMLGGIGLGLLFDRVSSGMGGVSGIKIFDFQSFLVSYIPIITFTFFILYFLIFFKRYKTLLMKIFLKFGYKEIRPFRLITQLLNTYSLFIFLLINKSINKNINTVKETFLKDFKYLEFTEKDLSQVFSISDLANLIMDKKYLYFSDGDVDILENINSYSNQKFFDTIKEKIDKMKDKSKKIIEIFGNAVKGFSFLIIGIILMLVAGPFFNGMSRALGGALNSF